MSKDRQRARAARERAAGQREASPQKGGLQKGTPQKDSQHKGGPQKAGPQKGAQPDSARATSRRAPRPAARPGATPARRRGGAREPVYRLRRFPPLPWRLKAALAVGWLAVAAAVLFLVPTWTGRLGLLVVATAALPLIVVLVRDPSRRTR